jgi:hypothetical protein
LGVGCARGGGGGRWATAHAASEMARNMRETVITRNAWGICSTQEGKRGLRGPETGSEESCKREESKAERICGGDSDGDGRTKVGVWPAKTGGVHSWGRRDAAAVFPMAKAVRGRRPRRDDQQAWTKGGRRRTSPYTSPRRVTRPAKGTSCLARIGRTPPRLSPTTSDQLTRPRGPVKSMDPTRGSPSGARRRHVCFFPAPATSCRLLARCARHHAFAIPNRPSLPFSPRHPICSPLRDALVA